MTDHPAPTASRAPLAKQGGLYVLVGAIAFAVDFALLWVLHTWAGMPAWAAGATAFLVSTVISYLGQRNTTFASAASHRVSMLRYALLLAANTVATALIVQGFEQAFGLLMVGKVVSTGLTTLWNFPLMKYWVFPSDQR